jgi:hypothetical protein
MSARAPRRRCAACLLILVALTPAAVALAAPALASATAPAPSARIARAGQIQAPRQQLLAIITPVLKVMARKSASAWAGRIASWSESQAAKVTDAIVTKWITSHATFCPAALPRWFFCSAPPRPTWGRGVALQLWGRNPGVFGSPTVVTTSIAGLIPGRVFWLRCWVGGRHVDNGAYRSDTWYQLPSGGWVSAAWLYTGPIRQARC